MTKVGLLGGSFDPVHLAHVALAETAFRILKLDEVQLIPAANPWQREPLGASAEHRLALLRLAVAGRPHLRVNPVEIQRGGETYTIDTVVALPGGIEYYWIFGADQLRNFCTWQRWQDIVERVHLVVADRPGTPLDVAPELRARLQAVGRELIELPFEPMSISASDIRERLASGRPIRGMVDVAVEHYIKQNNLYQPTLC